MFSPLRMIRSLVRPVTTMRPSGRRWPRSPVRNQPSRWPPLPTAAGRGSPGSRWRRAARSRRSRRSAPRSRDGRTGAVGSLLVGVGGMLTQIIGRLGHPVGVHDGNPQVFAHLLVQFGRTRRTAADQHPQRRHQRPRLPRPAGPTTASGRTRGSPRSRSPGVRPAAGQVSAANFGRSAPGSPPSKPRPDRPCRRCARSGRRSCRLRPGIRPDRGARQIHGRRSTTSRRSGERLSAGRWCPR